MVECQHHRPRARQGRTRDELTDVGIGQAEAAREILATLMKQEPHPLRNWRVLCSEAPRTAATAARMLPERRDLIKTPLLNELTQPIRDYTQVDANHPVQQFLHTYVYRPLTEETTFPSDLVVFGHGKWLDTLMAVVQKTRATAHDFGLATIQGVTFFQGMDFVRVQCGTATTKQLRCWCNDN